MEQDTSTPVVVALHELYRGLHTMRDDLIDERTLRNNMVAARRASAVAHRVQLE